MEIYDVCAPPLEPPLETDFPNAPLSRERMEFQSHDCAASVELESQLALVESPPTSTPSSLAHLPLLGGGGWRQSLLCST